jgi:iron uptake system EfeUOB component EfeO/EfeM
MTANLQPGEYDMTCGLLTNPKGKLIVKGEATADAAKGDAVLSLGDAITAYKAYVTKETRSWLRHQSLYRCGESGRYRKSEIAVCADPSALRAH